MNEKCCRELEKKGSCGGRRQQVILPPMVTSYVQVHDGIERGKGLANVALRRGRMHLHTFHVFQFLQENSKCAANWNPVQIARMSRVWDSTS
jgi:hypothetical protein